MPDFSDPKYASYIQLCRELRLLKEWEPGDWLINENAGEPVLTQFVPGWHVRGLEAIWLPSLADWLEMLNKAALVEIFSLHLSTSHHNPAAAEWMAAVQLDSSEEFGAAVWGPTCEEAAARLWVTVSPDGNPGGGPAGSRGEG